MREAGEARQRRTGAQEGAGPGVVTRCRAYRPVEAPVFGDISDVQRLHGVPHVLGVHVVDLADIMISVMVREKRTRSSDHFHTAAESFSAMVNIRVNLI